MIYLPSFFYRSSLRNNWRSSISAFILVALVAKTFVAIIFIQINQRIRGNSGKGCEINRDNFSYNLYT